MDLITITSAVNDHCTLATDNADMAKAWIMTVLGEIKPHIFLNFTHKFHPEFLDAAKDIVRSCFGTPV